MGWGRALMLGNIGNRLDIEDCENEITRLKIRLKRKSRIDMSQDQLLKEVQQENDELKLYLAALLRLLICKDVLSKEEFTKFVDIIDAADGSVDGKVDGDIV